MAGMRFPIYLAIVVALNLGAARAAGVSPEVVQLSFDRSFNNPGILATAGQPKWVSAIEQQGGQYLDAPRSWQVPASAPEGVGRLAIAIDRSKMNEDLVATILFEASADADFAVQLFDAQGRVVVVDLFGNLVDVGKEATTNTFVVALRKYPTASRLVLRRVKGAVTVYGVVLYPVVTEGEPNNAALQKLAGVLGDPLSPENPLLQSIQAIARNGNVSIQPVGSKPAPAPASGTTLPIMRKPIPPAILSRNGPGSSAPTEGLVAHWSFDDGTAADQSGRGHVGKIVGGTEVVPGVRGSALRLRAEDRGAVVLPPSPDFDLKDTMTVAAWVRPATRRGGQLVWFGDRQNGRDPWLIKMMGDWARFRSDRSVTGQAQFLVRNDEIVVTPSGEKILSQHVEVDSPGTFTPDQWYFAAGTIERVTARQRAFKLYINSRLVGEVRTDETVNYPTNKMWVVLGAVHGGETQNWDGTIDEVRLYRRALSAKEIEALYHQPQS